MRLRPQSIFDAHLKYVNQGFELDQADTRIRLELYHDVDLAFRTHLTPGGGSEQGQLFGMIAAADRRQHRA